MFFVFPSLSQVATKNMPKTGSICQVLVQLPHVFQMFPSDSFMDHDARLDLTSTIELSRGGEKMDITIYCWALRGNK